MANPAEKKRRPTNKVPVGQLVGSLMRGWSSVCWNPKASTRFFSRIVVNEDRRAQQRLARSKQLVMIERVPGANGGGLRSAAVRVAFTPCRAMTRRSAFVSSEGFALRSLIVRTMNAVTTAEKRPVCKERHS